MWKHEGGGCGIGWNTLYPCDDSYRNDEKKERVTIYCTMDRHFNMPSKVESLDELTALEGVSPDICELDWTE